MATPKADSSVAEALSALRGHEHGEVLARVVGLELLARAEAKRHEPEPEAAERAASESGLSDEDRRTGLGDPFAALGREPEDRGEVALLEAALGLHLQRSIERASATERSELLSRTLESLDWLEVFAPISPYRGVGAALTGELSDTFWDAVAEGLVESVAPRRKDTPPQARRREVQAIVRAAALANAPAGTRAALAGRLAADLPVGTPKRLALASLAGVDDAEVEAAREAARDPSAAVRAAAAARAPRLEGALEGRPWGPVGRLLAALTGVLLVRWLARLVARYLLGYRREGAVSLGASTLKVEHRVKLLGRVIRSGETSHSLRTVRSGGLEVRFPHLHLVVGALVLVLAAGLGASFVVEGTCASYPPLVLLGVAVVGGGLLLDLLLEILVPARKGVSTFSLDMGRRGLRLRGVAEDRARELAAALDQVLQPPGRG